MEELLDDDGDDDELKVEKSSVEKMEKHCKFEPEIQEPQPAGTETCMFFSHTLFLHVSFTFVNVLSPVSINY